MSSAQMARGDSRKRILVADGRPEVLRLVDRTLSQQYALEFASSAEEARAKLGRDFDLVLWDIQMPGAAGLAATEELSREHPQTAVVLVTGVDDPEIAAQVLEIGVSGYLVKPFWPGQLQITATNALRRHELERAQEANSRTLEERLQMLMDTAPVPIYIKDKERRYKIANRVAHRVAGLEPSELVGRTDADFMSVESERVAAESDRRILEEGATYEAEERMTVAGEEKTFHTIKFPFVDEMGQIAGISGISTDITAKRQAEELQQQLAADQQQEIEELRASRLEVVERLTRAIALRGAGTAADPQICHMALIAAYLGHKLGMDREEVALLRAAAPMHDIGELATPDAILCKPGKLTPEERKEMERHSTVGHEILDGSNADLLRMAASIALSHHERWDGSGYPLGLRGEEIPLEGRIVAVADVFDAMLSNRCHRPALPVAEAVAAIEEGRGTHFDPRIADLLLEHREEALALRD